MRSSSGDAPSTSVSERTSRARRPEARDVCAVLSGPPARAGHEDFVYGHSRSLRELAQVPRQLFVGERPEAVEEPLEERQRKQAQDQRERRSTRGNGRRPQRLKEARRPDHRQEAERLSGRRRRRISSPRQRARCRATASRSPSAAHAPSCATPRAAAARASRRRGRALRIRASQPPGPADRRAKPVPGGPTAIAASTPSRSAQSANCATYKGR